MPCRHGGQPNGDERFRKLYIPHTPPFVEPQRRGRLLIWRARGPGIIRGRRIPGPVTKRKQRRCLHCRHLFHRNPRTRTQQRFCSASACRAASKKASQQRWLCKPENQDYFRGDEHVNRVRAWRAKQSEYGQEPALNAEPLQEMIMEQSIDLLGKYGDLPLQDEIGRQVGEPVEEIGI